MSILDSVRDAVSSVIPVGKDSEDDIQHGSTGKKQAEIGEDGVPQSVLDAINDAENGTDESYDDSDDGERGDDRTDILELLNIDANYTIPDEYMLPEDFERVVFDKVRPEGYDEKMVNAFYDSAYNTVGYLLDLLKKRNKDIATLATQIDKMSTDLHNAKLNAEISDGLTVMTGAPSEDAISLQQAQNEIRKLRGTIKKMESAGLQPADNDSGLGEKYDALQNQVGILKSKIQQLSTENKRLRLGRSVDIEDDMDVLNDDPIAREAADDAGGMPMPWSGSDSNSDNSSDNLTMGAQSYATGPRTIGDTLSTDDGLDVDNDVLPMPGASSNTRGNDPNNDPNNGLRMSPVTPAVPDDHDNDSNDGGLPLPSIMDESYEDIGIPLDNNSDDSDGEIDLASMIV